MIIENINGTTIIYAEENNKITNLDRTFFTKIIYLGINDNISNYEEVTKDIWQNYIETLDPTDKEVINTKIETLEQDNLTTMLAVAELYEILFTR